MSSITKRGTSLDIPNAIVERDPLGNFSAGTITANLNGTINGITITGTPIAGEALVATSSTTADWATAPSAVDAINLTGGTAGEIPYQSAPSTTSFDPNLLWDGTNHFLGLRVPVPAAPLDIYNNAGAVTTWSIHTVGDNHRSGLQADSYGTGPLPSGVSTRNARGTQASPAAVLSGDTLGGFFASGYNSSAFPAAPNASIAFNAAETFTATANGSKISLNVTPTTTTSNSSSLSLSATTTNTQLTLAAAGVSAIIQISSGSGNLVIACNPPGAFLALNVNGHADSVHINATGVGIRNSNPLYPLDVTGDINTSTAYRVGGVLLASTNLSDTGTIVHTLTAPALTGTNFTGNANSLTVGNAGFAMTAANIESGAAGSLPYQTSFSHTTFLSIGSTNDLLTVSGGGVPLWVSRASIVVGNATNATNATYATNLAGGNTGQIPFQSAPNTTAFSSQLFWDNADGRLGIQNLTPGYPLDVVGDINTSTLYRVGGVAVLDSSGAYDLKDSTGSVNVSAATAPTTGQVLTATDATHATWQTPTGGGSSPANGSTIGTFSAGSEPQSIAFDGVNMWITNDVNYNNTPSTVTELAPNGSTVGTFSSGFDGYGIAFDGVNMWVTDVATSHENVVEINPAGSIIGTFPVGRGAYSIAFDGTNMWIPSATYDTVTELAPDGSVIGTFSVGSGPFSIAFDGVNMWVANNNDNTVTELAPDGTTLGTFAVGLSPFAIAFDGVNMWTANSGTNTVTVLSPSGATIGTYTVGNEPTALAFDGVNMWVVNYADNTVTELNLAGVTVGTFPVGNGPSGIAYDGKNMWVTNNSDGTVTELADSTVYSPAANLARFALLSNRNESPYSTNVETINVQTGTSYTFVLSDGSNFGDNPLVTFGSASATTVTVPLNSSVAFPVGAIIECAQVGTGKVTFTPAGGVTINSQAGNLSIAAQYVAVSLIQTAIDTWLLIGALIA